MAYERFDVVTALFPFTDTDIRKPRPVVVLSCGSFNAHHGHLVGVMITTGAKSRWPSDRPLHDLMAAGLGHPSVIRWKVFTLPYAVIGRRIGRLAAIDADALDGAVISVLGPGPSPASAASAGI